MKSGQGWKWAVGCGVLTVLGISLCVGSALWVFPRAVRGVRDAVLEETQRNTFAANWVPPHDDIPAEELFPKSVAGYQLQGHDEKAQSERFEIDLKGRHAIYGSTDASLEVFVYRASSLEREAIYRRVLLSLGALKDEDDPFADDADDPYAFRLTSGVPASDRLRFTVRPPFHRGRLWWHRGWLFFFLTKKEIELKVFEQKYLEAVQGNEPASAKMPAEETPEATKTE